MSVISPSIYNTDRCIGMLTLWDLLIKLYRHKCESGQLSETVRLFLYNVIL